MPLNLTTAAKAIKEKYEPVVAEAVFYNNEVIGLKGPNGRVFKVIKNQGGNNYNFKVHTAANSKIETFVEGDVHPEAGNQTYVNAALSSTYIWFVLEVTGHARDALLSNYFNPITDNMSKSIDGMNDLFSTTFLNDSTVGLQAAIDNNNTYGGIVRSSSSYWQSAVESSIGTLARADFESVIETQRSPAHLKGRTSLWLLPPEQVTNYGQLADFGTNDRRDVVSGGGKGFDLGWNWDGLMIHGSPALGMSDLTSSVILGLDTRPDTWKIETRRKFSEKVLAPTGDNDRIQYSMALTLVCKNPTRQAKMEGITP